MNKHVLRKALLEARRAMCAAEREEKSKAIFERISALPQYQSAKAVLVYISFDGEVDTDDILRDLGRRGVAVYLPLIINDIDFAPCKRTDETIKNRYGIDEPVPNETAPKGSGKIDLVICPGVGFDQKGSRVGYGKGYYDRYLSGENIYKIGLAFEAQMTTQIEAESDDIPMDAVVTEKAVYVRCG